MKLLTFLGTGKYEEVEYVWQDKPPIRTCYFASALACWLQPDEILVCLTKEAEKHQNWEDLKGRLPDPSPIHIPSGKSEDELWEIFSSITDKLDENDEVVFDITHAFRSIPLLAFLAAAYLRVAKSIQIKHLLYGAFDAQFEDKGVKKAPVFDLTPFLSLLDWTRATDQFLQTGDSRRMAQLLEDTNNALWRSPSKVENKDLPTRLSSLSGTLRRLSQALLTTRVLEIPEIARKLPSKISDAAPETEKWVQPFDVLLGKVLSEYQAFTNDPLDSQRQLIQWYLNKGYVIQAVTLAREWLVSWACLKFGKDIINDREKIEREIGNASSLLRPDAGEPIQASTEFDSKLRNESSLLDAWNHVSDLRNDIAHCGMRKQPRRSQDVYKKAEKIPEKLSGLKVPPEVIL